MIPPASPFAFATAGAVRFGEGAAAEAAPGIAALGRRALVICGASTARAAWLMEALEAAGVEALLRSVAGEPTVADAEAAARAAVAFGADVVVGIGGGAAIDAAKAAAGLAPQPGGAMDHLEVAVPALPIVAIPTTAGTGAEATRNAVLGVPERKRKVSLRDASLLPRLAVIDPLLARGAPRAVTLASGLDALTQVIEPYVSSRANPLTDALCRDAIPRALSALPRLIGPKDVTEDPQARADMALVGLFGGMALANAGLGAVHGLAGVLGGRAGGAHGAICGRLLPHALRANRAAPDLGAAAAARLDEIARLVGAAFGADPEDAFDALEAWIDAAGLPRLGALGIDPDDHARIAAESASSSSMKGNPVPLDQATLTAMLDAAG